MRCLRARFWGFRLASLVPVALLPRVPAFTQAAPTRCGVGAACVCAGVAAGFVCGRVCSLGGWLGFGVCAAARVCLGCLCFLGVGVLDWGGGVVWLRPPPFFVPACLRARASGVGLLACAVLLWVWGNGYGAGQCCPAPYGVALSG